MSICFTTALFGDPRTLDRPAKFERNTNYDYFLFTDINEEHFDTSWDIINIKDNPNISNLTSNVRKSRYPKFMSWELLGALGKSYDVVFYCDGWMHPDANRNWEELASKITSEKPFPLTQTHHHIKAIRKGGILEEMKLIVRSSRDSSDSMNKTKSFFEKYDPTVDLNFSQYYENTCFGYYFHNENVRDFTKNFWNIYITKDITYRDQPLWNFLLLKYDLKPIMQNDLGGHGSRDCYFISNSENMGKMRRNYKKSEIRN